MTGKIILTDLRTQEMRDAADYLADQGYEAVTVPESVCLWDEAALTSWAAQHREGLTGVIHPAPPLFLSPLETASEEEYARARDEGPIAAWCVTKVFGGILRARGGGSLIYLNSIHAEKPVGRGFLFSTGCAAVQMLSREVNQDYGTSAVRSFFIQRGITAEDPDGRSDLSPVYYGVDLRYPARRMPERGSLNPLLAFLLTEAAAPLAGSDLRADGGMTMYYGQRASEKELEELRKAYMLQREASIIEDD